MAEPSQEPQGASFPTPETIAGVYDEVLEHNRQHTGIGASFNAIFGAIVETSQSLDEGDGSPENVSGVTNAVNERMRQSADEGELLGDLVAWSADGPMGDIGLRINATGTYLAIGSMDDQDQKASARALEPWLDSPGKFAGFLDTLDTDTVRSNPTLEKLTTNVLSGIAKTVRMVYEPSPEQLLVDTTELEQVGESQLRAFASIAGAYEVLGLDGTPEFKQMSEYVKRWGEGVLPEYLVAEKKAYLNPDIQGFGPSRWQTDMTPGNFEERWQDAMDFVHVLLADPDKRKFGLEVQASLQRSLQDVKEWADNPPAHYPKDYMDRILPAITKIIERFGQKEM